MTAVDEQDRSQRNVWRIVARREIAVKLTDRSFVLGSLATLVFIIALIGLQVWLDGRTDRFTVAVTTPSATAMAEASASLAEESGDDVVINVSQRSSEEGARVAVEEEVVDAWLTTDDDGTWRLVTLDAADDSLRTLVEAAVRTEVLSSNAAEAGTSIADLTAGTELATEQLEGDAELSQLQDLLGFALAFLFYIASIIFGMTLAQSITEEKQSRIVEMIAAAVPLRQLLAGKILGNTVLAVGQMTIYVAVGLVGLAFTDFGDLIAGVTGDVVWFLAFFLVGFLALSCLWAVAGALASRNEDLQSTATPVTMLLLAIFLGTAFLDGTAEVVASYVPPFSAVAMPVRLVNGDASWWEASIALLLLLALAGVLVMVAERLYRRALMQTGGKLSMRQAWNLED